VLNTTLRPHSIIQGDACFAYFSKIRGIPLSGVITKQDTRSLKGRNQQPWVSSNAVELSCAGRGSKGHIIATQAREIRGVLT